MEKKYLKLKEGEEIIIFGNNKSGVLIKNINNKLFIKETEDFVRENICIKDIELSQLTCFILTKLLENNVINDNDCNKLINDLLEKQYNLFCGNLFCSNLYQSDDILNMKFQCITYYDN